MDSVKMILIMITMLAITSCAPKAAVIEKETSFFAFDFTSYTEKGFMFTPEKYTGEYESIGVVEITIYAKMMFHPYDSDGNRRFTWIAVPLDTDELIEAAYLKAIQMGANAVTNFTISSTSKVDEEHKIPVPGIRLNGFAIKRK